MKNIDSNANNKSIEAINSYSFRENEFNLNQMINKWFNLKVYPNVTQEMTRKEWSQIKDKMY